MKIRNAELKDIDTALNIYANARKYMAANGNPDQWKNENYPSRELLEYDVEEKRLFVVTDEEDYEILAVYAYIIGTDSSYEIIEGQWLNEELYGTIHRIASSGKSRGLAFFIYDWALEQCDNIRIDTHADNHKMQYICETYGFKQCGIIHLKGAGDEYDGDPRIAYQITKELRDKAAKE